MFVLTALEPLRKESRFRHTGNSISMQLKFRQAAGALANASARSKRQKREQGDACQHRTPHPVPQAHTPETSSCLERKDLLSQGFISQGLLGHCVLIWALPPTPTFLMKILKHKENCKSFHIEYYLSISLIPSFTFYYACFIPYLPIYPSIYPSLCPSINTSYF